MKNANAMIEKPEFSEEDVRERYRGFNVVSLGHDGADGFRVGTQGEISSYLRGSLVGPVELYIPRVLPSKIGGGVLWPLDCFGHDDEHPYGQQLTGAIAAAVLGRGWVKCQFGLAPGKFSRLNGGVVFEAKPYPTFGGIDTVLFWADSNAMRYGELNHLTSFKLQDAGLYGLAIPMNHLVESHRAIVGESVPALLDRMARNLEKYSLQT